MKKIHIVYISILIGALLSAGCQSYRLRSSSPTVGGGISTFTKKREKPPLQYESEEGVPYTTKLTYGEICVNSKRFGKEYCFPCYPTSQGGCDAAISDLIDKAIVCSANIGPSVPTLPTFQSAPQASFSPITPQVQTIPLTPYPNTYPNFSR